MGSITVLSETASPVSLSEAKDHLNVDHHDDDRLISAQIKAATLWCQHFCNRYFGYTQLRYDMNGASFDGELCLPNRPKEIISVVYDDVDGVEQTWATSNYELDSYNGRLMLSYDGDLPSPRSHWNSMRVTYAVGDYTGSPITNNVPKDIEGAILLVVGDLYENRERQQDMQLYDNNAAHMLLSPHRLYEA